MAVRFATLGDCLKRLKYGGVYLRDTGEADAAQAYSLSFKFTLKATVTSGSYRTIFTSLDSNSYLDGLWIGNYNGNGENISLEVYSVGANYDTVLIPTDLDTEVTIGYTRSADGLTHKAYADGTLIGSFSLPDAVAGPLMLGGLGGDGAGTNGEGDWIVRELREWEGVELSAAQLAAEAASGTPVVTSGLFSRIPLTHPDDILDVSGNGNHFERVKPGMPASPGVRFTQEGNTIPLTGNFTLFGMVRFEADSPSSFQGILELVDYAAAWATIQRNNGVPPSVYAGYKTLSGSATGAGAQIAPRGGFYPVALVQSGTSQTLYVLQTASSPSTVDYTGSTTHEHRIGHPTGDAGFVVAYQRRWTAALTAAELMREALSTVAVRTADLFEDLPLASDADDISGNYRHYHVASGSVTYVAQPPMPTESIGVTENVAPLLVTYIMPATVHEAITITESATRGIQPLISALVFDAIAITEVTVPLYPTLLARVHETIGFSERVTTFIPVLVATVHETIGMTEGPLNQNVSPGVAEIGPTPTTLPGGSLQDYWAVGIV